MKIDSNKIMDDIKKRKEEDNRINDKKFNEKLRKKIKEEDNKTKENKRQKKLNDIDKFQEWFGDFEKRKDNQKKEKEDEDNKLKNYAKEYNDKFIHVLDISRCSFFNKDFPKKN